MNDQHDADAELEKLREDTEIVASFLGSDVGDNVTKQHLLDALTNRKRFE